MPPSKKVVSEPVKAAPAAPQKSGAAPKVVKAKADAKAEVKPAAVPAKVEAAPAPVKGKAVVKAAAPKAEAKAVAPKVAKAEVAQKAGAKKAAAPKAAKAVKAPKAKKEVVEVDGEEAEDAKGVRSFKVHLPGTEDYAGRFTGLTPYQAANKALSKYFRENKQAKAEITFSIRESTRGSKRTTYTYNGKREKLAVPVKYSIKSADGVAREIVKEYKNKLTKVKKADVKEASA
jgi:hypothetical protein